MPCPSAVSTNENCHNCRTALNFGKTGGVFDQFNKDRVYCSANCYWSENLNGSKSRSKKKSRSGGGSRMARVRQRSITGKDDSSGRSVDSPRQTAHDRHEISLSSYAFPDPRAMTSDPEGSC